LRLRASRFGVTAFANQSLAGLPAEARRKATPACQAEARRKASEGWLTNTRSWSSCLAGGIVDDSHAPHGVRCSDRRRRPVRAPRVRRPAPALLPVRHRDRTDL